MNGDLQGIANRQQVLLEKQAAELETMRQEMTEALAILEAAEQVLETAAQGGSREALDYFRRLKRGDVLPERWRPPGTAKAREKAPRVRVALRRAMQRLTRIEEALANGQGVHQLPGGNGAAERPTSGGAGGADGPAAR